MFHFFAQTEPKKQKKSVVITSGGGQKQKATTEKSPLRRLVQHRFLHFCIFRTIKTQFHHCFLAFF